MLRPRRPLTLPPHTRAALRDWTEARPLVKPRRDLRLDALRGALLVAMTGVHLPTPVSELLHEPLGFVSTAEGFVFLAACLAGAVYGGSLRRNGWDAMSARVWDRARQVYLTHLALLLPIALAACALAGVFPSLANHFADTLQDPLRAFALMPFLGHQPPLFDVLPLYVLLLCLTPFLLRWGQSVGWGVIGWSSAALWLAAQLGWGWRNGHPAFDSLPYRPGAFDLLSWQALWVAGLWLGQKRWGAPGKERQAPRFPRVWIFAAGGVAAAGLLCSLGWWPQAWFHPDVYLWLDKWTLGPLRLANLGAIVLLLMAWNPRPPERWLRPLALLGRHSLAVFACHIPLVMIGQLWIETTQPSPAAASAAAILAMALVFPVAWIFEQRRLAQLSAPRENLAQLAR